MRHLQETEGRGRGQTKRNTCLRFPIEQPMNRTAPWSKWRLPIRGTPDVAVNVPVTAVALRESVVVKLFQRNGILFRPHLPRSVFLDFFRGRSHPLRSRFCLGPKSVTSGRHRPRCVAVEGVVISKAALPTDTPPPYLPYP